MSQQEPQLLLPAGKTALAEAVEAVSSETGRVPSLKQIVAVDKVIENGGNKGQALREAGYGAKTVDNPNRVFGSPTVLALMDRLGLSEERLAQKHKELLNSRFLGHMVFPLFKEKGKEEPVDETGEMGGNEDIDEKGRDVSEKKRGESLTDKDIRKLLASVNCEVQRIVHGEQARHVYFWGQNGKVQLQALDMAYNLRGSYAPKKLDTKANLTVGVFSISGLHKKMRENGLKSTDIINVEPLNDDISE